MLKTVRSTLKSASDVREWLGLSLAEAGRELARLAGRPSPYSKQYMSRLERLKLTPPDLVHGYAVLIANRLTEQIGRTVALFPIEVNSPWHIRPAFRCACGRWAELQRADQKRGACCQRGKHERRKPCHTNKNSNSP